jgi:hypothetical protein
MSHLQNLRLCSKQVMRLLLLLLQRPLSGGVGDMVGARVKDGRGGGGQGRYMPLREQAELEATSVTPASLLSA